MNYLLPSLQINELRTEKRIKAVLPVIYYHTQDLQLISEETMNISVSGILLLSDVVHEVNEEFDFELYMPADKGRSTIYAMQVSGEIVWKRMIITHIKGKKVSRTLKGIKFINIHHEYQGIIRNFIKNE